MPNNPCIEAPCGLLEIAYASPDYWQICDLRNEVLRKPLGLDLYDEDLSVEQAWRHFIWVHNNQISACILFNPHSGQLRQMAVHSHYQRQGIGTQMIKQLEDMLVKESVCDVWLNARMHVCEFYYPLGYRKYGKPFIELGIPHVRMQKKLISVVQPPTKQS